MNRWPGAWARRNPSWRGWIRPSAAESADAEAVCVGGGEKGGDQAGEGVSSCQEIRSQRPRHLRHTPLANRLPAMVILQGLLAVAEEFLPGILRPYLRATRLPIAALLP